MTSSKRQAMYDIIAALGLIALAVAGMVHLKGDEKVVGEYEAQVNEAHSQAMEYLEALNECVQGRYGEHPQDDIKGDEGDTSARKNLAGR